MCARPVCRERVYGTSPPIRDLSTPDRFRRRPKTQRYRAKTAFRPEAPGFRLLQALGDEAMFYTLRPCDLGLADHYEEASALYSPEDMAVIRRALGDTFSGPIYFAIEVGKPELRKRGKLHMHVVAHATDGPAHIQRHTERCKPITNPVGLWTYLLKPPESWSIAAELDYRAACVLGPKGQAPQTRGYIRSAGRTAWANANALSATPALPTPSRPSDLAESTLEPGTPLASSRPVETPAFQPEPGHAQPLQRLDHCSSFDFPGSLVNQKDSTRKDFGLKLPEYRVPDALLGVLQVSKSRKQELPTSEFPRLLEVPGTAFSTAHPANAPNPSGTRPERQYPTTCEPNKAKFNTERLEK